VLLWASEAWTTRDKLIGTLLVPGGLGFLLFLGTTTLGVGAGCTELIDKNGRVISRTCTDAGEQSFVGSALWVALLAVLVLGPIFTSIYLARRMRKARLPAVG
jgi:hypothetical protein